MKKAAVFPCKGLGDGLLFLQLSHNLFLNGYQVDTYHPLQLHQLQKWFPHLPILPTNAREDIANILQTYDRIFVSYDESSDFLMDLIKMGKKKYSSKVWVLNPSVSHRNFPPYYADALFQPDICMVKNMENLCKAVLHLPAVVISNGIQAPANLLFHKYPDRVIIHPLSAKAGKNWSKEKYLLLADALQKKGKQPVFVMTTQEKEEFIKGVDDTYCIQSFAHLHDLASYIYESGAMIGNDSGIGHLASCLGLSTTILFRSHRYATLWRPGWGKSQAIYPSKLFPNISGWRFRDKNWQKLISVRKVLNTLHV